MEMNLEVGHGLYLLSNP